MPSPKTVEDLFLADDLRQISPETAACIDRAHTHEEVDEIRQKLGDLLKGLS